MENLRSFYIKKICDDFEIFPIVGLLGARQVGKTTIAKQYASQFNEDIHYFDLEDYTDLAKLENPKLTLLNLSGLIVIDEIQRRPDLFPYLRVLADKKDKNLKILILGSASQDLLKQSSESLAGRIGYIDVSPFGLFESEFLQNDLWLFGGYPKSVLLKNKTKSFRWISAYLKTLFEKDLKDIGLNIPSSKIQKLWHLLAHYHGQTINYAQMAEFLDVSIPTIKNYLYMLDGTFIIRLLQPWHENAGKRIKKTPKLYIRDSGLYHYFLKTSTFEDLILNPKVGASFEGFCVEEIAKLKDKDSIFFWSTHQEAEVDLFFNLNGKKIGVEIKTTDSPKMTKSMRISMDALKLDHLYIVTPVESTFNLEENVTVTSIREMQKKLIED
ncbi:MAG: putative protein [Holosporales bacterium]